MQRSPGAYIVIDEVQVVPGCDGHGTTATLAEPAVSLVQCLVHIDECIDDGISVAGGIGQRMDHTLDVVRSDILKQIR